LNGFDESPRITNALIEPGSVMLNGMSRSLPRRSRLYPMEKPTQDLIAEVPRRHARTELIVGIDLGDVWSHYCTLNQHGEVVDRGRFRTTAKAIDKWFTDVSHARVAMEAGTHSIWISEQLEQLGHEVIVANVRRVPHISRSWRCGTALPPVRHVTVVH
jgi:hypothetical protein